MIKGNKSAYQFINPVNYPLLVCAIIFLWDSLILMNFNYRGPTSNLFPWCLIPFRAQWSLPHPRLVDLPLPLCDPSRGAHATGRSYCKGRQTDDYLTEIRGGG